MKKHRFLFYLFILLLPLQALSQIYRGGVSDGQSGISAGNLNLSVAGALYKGGGSDGDAVINAGAVNLTVTSALYKGGINDGVAIVSGIVNLTLTGYLYKGGINKGETQLTVPGVNLTVCGDTIVWNGNYNVNWENPANWDCGKVPDVNSIVIISGGRPRYPVIRQNTEIKKLELYTGTSVTLNAGLVLVINGH